MGTYLHKLGNWAFTHPWRVIGSWVLLLAVLGFLAVQFIKPTSSAISIPGTEAQVAIDRVGELFPDSGGATGRLVFQAKNGTSIRELQADILKLTDKVAAVDGVSRVASPFIDNAFISESGTIGYAQVQLKGEMGSVSAATIDEVAEAVAAARSDTLQVEIAGALINAVPEEFIGIGEVAGVVVAMIVLLMTLGSLVAAGMPLTTALLGIGVSTAGLFSLSQVIDISSTTPVLAIMLGLAVGIDYALFIINKHRYYALAGYSFQESAGKAVATAGNAVVFAALTVIIALSALTVVNIPFMTTMGLVGAASIAVAALVAISLLPALLRLAGPRVFGKKQRAKVAAAQKKKAHKVQALKQTSFWYRWGKTIVKRPAVFLVSAVIIIGVIAWPARDLTLGLPTDQYAAQGSTQRTAYELLSEGFGAGFNGPLTVIVEGLPAVSDAEREAIRAQGMQDLGEQVAEATAKQQEAFAQKAAAAVTVEDQMALQAEIAAAQAAGEAQKAEAIGAIEKSVAEYAKLVQLNKLAGIVAERDNVAQVLPAMATEDGTKGILQVVPKSAPADSATVDLINNLRDPATPATLGGFGDVTLAVTGSVALEDDINSKLAAALPVYLAVVVGLSLVLLIVAFRSILVPVKATLGFLLSVLAMFGALVAVFQWGWFGIAEAPGPIVSFIPIIAIGVLFGLAMDYEFFLVSGMHEAYEHTKKPRQAVVNGFGMGAKVVTAAGVIMVSVFAGFIFNHDATIQAIGFALAIGILVDVFLVRMTIVPAVMALLGKSAWWLPKWLEKRRPHISIEGESDK